MYDDLFQNKHISKTNIFMEWFVNNNLMSNIYFEWNNGFIVTHPIFTTLFCKYIITLFYIFTRITNICWLYFMVNNYILHLFNTNDNNNNYSGNKKWILIYICAVIIIIQTFAHIMLTILAIKAYNFERSIWFLLPMLNEKHIDRLLDTHFNTVDKTIKNIINLYESFCYKHIISNCLYNYFGYNIGVIIMSYLGHHIYNENVETCIRKTTIEK
eukprot:307364_1